MYESVEKEGNHKKIMIALHYNGCSQDRLILLTSAVVYNNRN